MLYPPGMRTFTMILFITTWLQRSYYSKYFYKVQNSQYTIIYTVHLQYTYLGLISVLSNLSMYLACVIAIPCCIQISTTCSNISLSLLLLSACDSTRCCRGDRGSLIKVRPGKLQKKFTHLEYSHLRKKQFERNTQSGLNARYPRCKSHAPQTSIIKYVIYLLFHEIM